MRKKRILVASLVIILSMLVAIPIMASALSSPANVQTVTDGMTVAGSTYGICPEPYTNTFYALDRHWLFFLDEDSDFVYASSDVSGQPWTEHIIEAATGLYAVEFSIWYDAPRGVVHYARHDMNASPDEVVYRMGTPNADGTITWAAAEQTVSTTPADLITWRTTIAVDEDGYPWVVWIDTNDVDAYGIVYVEASSTRDGTWTQVVAVSDEIDVADFHAWFVQLCPIQATPGNLMEIIWSYEDQTGGPNDGEVALEARRYNTGTDWTITEDVAALGDMAAVAPHFFDSYDVGTTVWVAYTEAATGDLYVRARTSAQTWTTADAASLILDDAEIGYAPTLAGYRANGAGEDIILIYGQDITALGYCVHTYGDPVGTWGATQHIWTVSDAEADYITRHNVAYQYGSPVGFTWQVTHLDVEEEPEYDTVYYWWIDGDNGGLGYYPTPTGSGNTILQILMPIIVALGIIMTGLGAWRGDMRVAFIGVAVGIVGFVLIQALLQLT